MVLKEVKSLDYSHNMFGLSNEVIKDISDVLKKHPNIDKVLIFGSRAKGNYTEGSDIDLALIGENISFNELLDINIQVEDLGLLYKVDIVDYSKNIGTAFGEHIDRVGLLFYEKQ